jgi:acetyl esterase/lipase
MHLRKVASLTGLLLAAGALWAQTDVVPIWPGAAPGSENWSHKEVEYVISTSNTKGVRNVVRPTLTVYLPAADKATGTAVVVAPGGAFRMLSWEFEGTMVADWLQRHGVAAFILKYRLTDTGTDEEFAASQARSAARAGGGGAGVGRSGAGAARGAGRGGMTEIQAMSAADGRQAVKFVREHAGQYRIDPKKVGIMGFSAGGYVALASALENTPETRPDFVGAIYACCVTADSVKVPEDAPPTFFLHAYNDPVSVSSPSLFLAWKAAGRPAELHTYADGGHGFGMLKKDLPSDTWIERFGEWLRYQKLMK